MRSELSLILINIKSSKLGCKIITRNGRSDESDEFEVEGSLAPGTEDTADVSTDDSLHPPLQGPPSTTVFKKTADDFHKLVMQLAETKSNLMGRSLDEFLREAGINMFEDNQAGLRAAPAEPSEPTPAPVRELTPEPVREPTPEPMREPTPEPTRESTPQLVRQSTPEPTSAIVLREPPQQRDVNYCVAVSTF